MYDRPAANELIQAARHHFETGILPLTRETHHKLYFQTLVAINVLKIVERELAHSSAHFRAEWSRLNMIQGNMPLPESTPEQLAALEKRNADLCTAIRRGDHDTDSAVFEHLRQCAIEQLEVANPKYLAMLRAEDAQKTQSD